MPQPPTLPQHLMAMDTFFCFATRTKDAATSAANVAVSMTQKQHIMPPVPWPMPNTTQVDCFLFY